MSVLTTRQRDLLTMLINSDAPKGIDELAEDLNLTPREVNYGLRGIKQWLQSNDIEFEIKTGAGISLGGTKRQTESLLDDLVSINYLQLVLSVEERQQLLALYLLVTDEPKYLQELETLTQVSRTTVIKDVDNIEAWLNKNDATIARRPNYGIKIEAHEGTRQKLITMLLWGEAPFGKSLVQINYTEGLIFELAKYAELHPLVSKSKAIF